MMNDDAQRYPLSWPDGWKRTPRLERQRATFQTGTTRTVTRPDGSIGYERNSRALSVADAIRRLSGELARLGADREVMSSNLAVRLDGLPRSGQAEPTDPGIAVYFRLNNKPRCLACDRWDRVADNIAAIAQHIDALRRIERYGVGTMEQAFAGYSALPASPSDWWIVLGVSREATKAQMEDAYRAAARKAHPDAGGSHNEMARVNAARDAAVEDLKR